MRDAERCVALNPQFAKGYNRKALALYQLGRYVESEQAALAGLKVDPENAALKSTLKTAQIETADSPEVQAQMYKFRQESRVASWCTQPY